MSRGQRLELAGGMHHVVARTPKGLRLFKSRSDCRLYLFLLAEVAAERSWSVLSYCLMGNHVHLLVVTTDADLGAGIKEVHERFVRAMHNRYETYGPLLQNFKNKLVGTAEYEIACLRYIARNPVKAGLCVSPADWEWSAHRALAGLIEAPEFLDVTAVRDAIALESYVELVETSDSRLLEHLASRGDTWVADAVDDYAIPIVTVARHLRCAERTAYRRLEEARGRKGRVP